MYSELSVHFHNIFYINITEYKIRDLYHFCHSVSVAFVQFWELHFGNNYGQVGEHSREGYQLDK